MSDFRPRPSAHFSVPTITGKFAYELHCGTCRRVTPADTEVFRLHTGRWVCRTCKEAS